MILDGNNMTTREKAHEEIAEKMRFPEWYGRNLDALYDLMTEFDGEVELIHSQEMLASLGMYGEKLLAALRDAAQANPRLCLKVE